MAFDVFMIVRDAQGRQAPNLPVGESLDQTYKGAMELSEFSLGAENTIAIGSTTTGAGTGKATFKEFTVKKAVDSASGVFFKTLATGAHFQNVTLYIRKAGGTVSGKPYLIYSFGTVVVSSIEWSGSSGDDLPTETITFAYGQLQISYAQQTATGTLMAPKMESWDRVANRAPTAPLPVPES